MPLVRAGAAFVPWHEVEGAANVVVDAQAAEGTILTLSHHPESGSSPVLRADTSTAIVDRFLRLPPEGRPTPKDVVVSNDHFDEDGLFGLWLLIEQPGVDDPRRALACEAAAAGDFCVWTRPEAAWCAIAAMAMAEGATTPLPMVRRALARTDGRDPAGDLYREILPRVGRILGDPERFSDLWGTRWARVVHDQKALEDGTARLKEIPAADLAVLRADRSIDDLAVFSRTEMSRLLTLDATGTATLRYRYEGWVDYPGRNLPPRRPLAPLADLLKALIPEVGWRHDHESAPRPRLWSSDERGRAAPVADPTRVVETMAAYLSGGSA